MKLETKKCPKCGTMVWIHFTTDDPKGPYIPQYALCFNEQNCGARFSMEEYKELKKWDEESPFDKSHRLSAP